MTFEYTSENHVAPRPTSGLVTLGLFAGLGAVLLSSRGSRITRFAIGALPLMAVGTYNAWFPRKGHRQIPEGVQLLEAKETGSEPSTEPQSRIANFFRPVAYQVARASLYPVTMVPSVFFSGVRSRAKAFGAQEVMIESPIRRGQPETHLLEGVRIAPKNPVAGKKVIALLFPGNFISVSMMWGVANLYLKEGAYVQIVDWRGYHKSGSANPDVEGTHLDVEAMVDVAAQWHEEGEEVSLIFDGISLGAHHALYAAGYAAEKHPGSVSGTYASHPFGTLRSVMEDLGFPKWFARLGHWFYPYDNIKAAEKLASVAPGAEVHIIRGEKDWMMNPHHVEGESWGDINAAAIFDKVSSLDGSKLIDQPGMSHGLSLLELDADDQAEIARRIRLAANS